MCVIQGEEAFFPCIHSQADILPLWRINGVLHSTTRLPARHEFNTTGLIVSTDLSLDGSTYSCWLQFLDPEIGVMVHESKNALLRVRINSTLNTGEAYTII